MSAADPTPTVSAAPDLRNAGPSGAPATARSVTIAICTFHRNEGVVRAVEAVVAQLGVAPVADVLVVDNDPAAGARDVVGDLAERVGATVRYVHEPRPGIAAARNRCLDEVAHDLLVFLDDDEHPRPGWLEQLLVTHASTGATAVAGPVESEFESELDPWIAAGGFFARWRFPTGTSRPVAATNNLLLDTAEIARLGLRFDERYGLTGGSDTLFTRQLTRAGGRIVWCDEAVVVDRTPAARATRAWVLRRAHRSGNASTRTEIVLSTGTGARAVTRVRRLVGGLARIASGWAQVAVGTATRSLPASARGRRRVSRGAGCVTAALGRTHVEYARSGSGS